MKSEKPKLLEPISMSAEAGPSSGWSDKSIILLVVGFILGQVVSGHLTGVVTRREEKDE